MPCMWALPHCDAACETATVHEAALNMWAFGHCKCSNIFCRSDLSQVPADLRKHSSAMATRNGAAGSQAPLVSDTLQRMGLPAVSTAGAATHASRALNFTSSRG